MVIKQGDLFWVDLGEPSGSEPAYRRPHVIVQNNIFNRSNINTVVICGLTSNLKRRQSPGNVYIPKGEANLIKDSVINISQIFTINKSDLGKKIGTLSSHRVLQIIEGLKLLLEPRDLS